MPTLWAADPHHLMLWLQIAHQDGGNAPTSDRVVDPSQDLAQASEELHTQFPWVWRWGILPYRPLHLWRDFHLIVADYESNAKLERVSDKKHPAGKRKSPADNGRRRSL